ncbi:MAG TPA: class I SAM-dependent rRNA methyltransferase [Ignavibacteria bacterium]|nr:class I SAM-dependent rRNA methyltransferase [Ignavibacteria bacterium]
MNIYLKKNQERRLLAGHLWVFSNEISSVEGEIVNGGICDIYSSQKKFIGRGYYNRNSLIAARILSHRKEEINKEFIKGRIINSKSRRESIDRTGNAYRIVNGDSDYIPGLIIDYFNGDYTFQIFSLGIENFKNEIIDVLKNDLNANTIIAKNNFQARKLENLELYEEIVYEKNEYDKSVFEIDNIRYSANLLEGQKTGFYLDQNENRFRIRRFINENTAVLDLFCNDGGFALNAAYSKANKIKAVDSSFKSIANAGENASINGFNNIEFIESDVFQFLKSNQDEKYELIILDPPSFTKSKKELPDAIKGYIELNSSSLKILKPNGILFTFSCSHYISESDFINMLRKSANFAGKKIQIIFYSNCSDDHPVLPSMPETLYLKSAAVRVLE